MALHVAAILRVGSVVDQFIGPGQTETAIRTTLGPTPIPEGPYGTLRLFIVKTQAHSHDSAWGSAVFTGDLLNFNDGKSVRQWWKGVNLALGEHAYLAVTQGVLHLMVDGERPVMIDHMGAILEGLEMTGDE